MRSQNVHSVDHQLLDADMNYQLAVYFAVPIIGQSLNFLAQLRTLNRSFKYFCGMYMKLCQVSIVSLVVLSFSVVKLYDTGIFSYLYCRIQAKIIKAKAFLCLKMAL